MLRKSLLQAQKRMKQYIDQNRLEMSFQAGDFVYLKLHSYKQSLAVIKKNVKLIPKCYWPYKMLKKVGNAAYKLELLERPCIHLVFHVLLLKQFAKDHVITTNLL